MKMPPPLFLYHFWIYSRLPKLPAGLLFTACSMSMPGSQSESQSPVPASGPVGPARTAVALFPHENRHPNQACPVFS
jgi:hypothetical protein